MPTKTAVLLAFTDGGSLRIEERAQREIARLLSGEPFFGPTEVHDPNPARPVFRTYFYSEHLDEWLDPEMRDTASQILYEVFERVFLVSDNPQVDDARSQFQYDVAVAEPRENDESLTTSIPVENALAEYGFVAYDEDENDEDTPFTQAVHANAVFLI